jgi:hypothetical protein
VFFPGSLSCHAGMFAWSSEISAYLTWMSMNVFGCTFFWSQHLMACHHCWWHWQLQIDKRQSQCQWTVVIQTATIGSEVTLVLRALRYVVHLVLYECLVVLMCRYCRLTAIITRSLFLSKCNFYQLRSSWQSSVVSVVALVLVDPHVQSLGLVAVQNFMHHASLID